VSFISDGYALSGSSRTGLSMSGFVRVGRS
jgi:hypothetical protein